MKLRLLTIACALLWAQASWLHPVHAAVVQAQPPCHTTPHEVPADTAAHDCCATTPCSSGLCHCVGSTALAMNAVKAQPTPALWIVAPVMATVDTRPVALPAEFFRPPI